MNSLPGGGAAFAIIDTFGDYLGWSVIFVSFEVDNRPRFAAMTFVRIIITNISAVLTLIGESPPRI